MGLLDKLKNMFTEEEVEENEPIKKEVFQVEIPAPNIEEKEDIEEEIKKEPIKKEEPTKREEKFVFPVYFDDADFDDEPKKEKVKPVIPEKKIAPVKKPEVKKTFKPSPVISPVYGVLDKNYKKEDIVAKRPSTSREDYFNYKGSDEAIAFEDIRKKAFGTLEDELENTLTKVEVNKYEDIAQTVTPKEKKALEDEAVKNSQEEDIEDMFFNSNMTLEEAISKYESKNKEDLEKVNNKDDLIESDLFNLIDSMYEKKESGDE